MANRSRPRGLTNDPRLVERRGDLRGFSALVFLALLLIGFALVASLFVLVTQPPAAPPTPSPSPSPTVGPTLSSSPSPAPTASIAVTPAPSIQVIDTAIGDSVTLRQGGADAGKVSVLSTSFTRKLKGQDAARGTRWLIASIRYRATADLEYDSARWFVLDDAGKRFPWIGSGDRDPALGVGTLDAGKGTTGNVTFLVPTSTRMTTLILTDDQGNDLIRVALK